MYKDEFDLRDKFIAKIASQVWLSCFSTDMSTFYQYCYLSVKRLIENVL